jgi:ABC-type molybdenum transport system ATPase subunit/photorepair protein PhrA
MKRKASKESEALRASQEHEQEKEAEIEVDPTKFHNGSIYRITLQNFVTYTCATIFPVCRLVLSFWNLTNKQGPRLNVVIGPNGSGKSSLVSAIALGLGASTKVLGIG